MNFTREMAEAAASRVGIKYLSGVSSKLSIWVVGEKADYEEYKLNKSAF